jgi:FHA domain
MRITRCVPLPGQGLVARFDNLIAISDGLGPGPDLLLDAVEGVRAAAGDGGTLVRTAALAALESDAQRSFACVGTTSTDELVVLVSGDATATVVIDGGQPVTLSGSSSLIPVSQIFTGAVITLTVALAESTAGLPAADDRLRLDGGIVHGAGLAIAVTSPLAQPSASPQPGAELHSPVRGQPTADLPAPVGVLLLDDGTGFALDTDYVVGREPALDTDVVAGRARPLRIPDPEGTVSRLHLRVSVTGEQVEVSDLGSGNGSVVHPAAGEPLRLVPNEPTVIKPGARITVGDRSLEYRSYAEQSPRKGSER